MSEWGKEILKKLCTSDFKPINDHTVQAKTAMGMVHQHEWLQKEETALVKQFPAITCCIVRYTVRSKLKKYNFYIKKNHYASHLISIQFPMNNQKGTVKCFLSQGSTNDPDIPVPLLKQAFVEWLQNLPDYRLRFVTGEWELIGEFCS